MNVPVLYLIVPCYNEEKVLPITSRLFLDKLQKLIGGGVISDGSRILFVNDGSTDATWDIIRNLAKKDPHYMGISQSCNRGHQNAVLAGLMEARTKCDITISVDCDGQDDVNAIDEMIRAYLQGNEVVYGVRSNRETDSLFKRCSAEAFYKLMKRLGADIVFNHADYRLVSGKVLDELSCFREVNIFLRGLIPLVGFKSTTVFYKREKRLAGESHYPLNKMAALALDGITSLSIKPIRLISALGFLVVALSFIGILWAVVATMMGNTVSGWSSTVCIICFMGGVQLLSLGVLGEYIGKIYMETKRRPRYIISERTYEIRPGEENEDIEDC